jgi:flagellar protein FliO/FliZ
MLFGLGIVLLLIAGGAWLLKRISDSQFGLSNDIKVVSAVAVGPKERVVLVDVGEMRLVLGVAPGRVNKLMEVPRPEGVATPEGAKQISFIDRLKERLVARGEIK